jgi:hypothetical protein
VERDHGDLRRPAGCDRCAARGRHRRHVGAGGGLRRRRGGAGRWNVRLHSADVVRQQGALFQPRGGREPAGLAAQAAGEQPADRHDNEPGRGRGVPSRHAGRAPRDGRGPGERRSHRQHRLGVESRRAARTRACGNSRSSSCPAASTRAS